MLKLVDFDFLTGVKMTLYKPINVGTVYDSLERARARAISHANSNEFYGYTREYIDVLKKGARGQTAQQLGYVAVKKGTVRGQRHYLWVSGKKSDWRILDKSGRVIRKPTKADREFWGI